MLRSPQASLPRSAPTAVTKLSSAEQPSSSPARILCASTAERSDEVVCSISQLGSVIVSRISINQSIGSFYAAKIDISKSTVA